MAVGLAKKKIDHLVKSEHQAVRDYTAGIDEAKRKKDTRSTKTLGHIRGEEKQHASMLKNLR